MTDILLHNNAIATRAIGRLMLRTHRKLAHNSQALDKMASLGYNTSYNVTH